MNMKKLLKLAGVAAVLAAVIPYAHTKDEETQEETLKALLWKLTTRPDPEAENKKKTVLDIGLLLPSRKQVEDETEDVDDLFLGDEDFDDEDGEHSDFVIDITIEPRAGDEPAPPVQPE